MGENDDGPKCPNFGGGFSSIVANQWRLVEFYPELAPQTPYPGCILSIDYPLL
jgi:hypothetical protein